MEQKKFDLTRLGIYAGILLAVLIYSQSDVLKHVLNCPLRFSTGWLCPTCGGTRAAMSFFRFDFKESIGYNAVAFWFIIPVLCLAAFQDVFVIISRFITKNSRKSFLEFLFTPELYMR